jgi:hypothetical protein
LTEQRVGAEASVRLVRALRRVVGELQERPPAQNLREQIAYLERDVQEVRTRVNALFFTVLTTAVGQLLARFFA